MKILHVISGYLPYDTGGTQLHLRDLCRSLRSLGHEVEIFARLGGDEFPEFHVGTREWDGVRVTSITNNFHDVTSFEMLFEHEVIDARFSEILVQYNPDVVHIHHLTGLSCSLIRVAKSLGLPVVMTLHDYWMVCPRGQRIHPETLEVCEQLDRKRCVTCLQALWPHLLPEEEEQGFFQKLLGKSSVSEKKLDAWEAFVKDMLDRCDFLIAPSRFHRDRFVEWGCRPEQVVAIAHGLPTKALRAEPRGRSPVRRIGFIGSVIPSKGVMTLVEAFNLLNREDVNLEIYGDIPNFHGDRGYREQLDATVFAHLSMTLHGRYDHRLLPQILGRLDILVVPSLWWETFCLTAREGALAGIPVIGSYLGGIADAVDDGLIVGFAAGDSRDLAEKLDRLIRDAGHRDEMSRKAGLVRDLDDCTRETLSLYRQATSAVGVPD